MLKSSAAALLLAFAAFSPALAADKMECTEANMTKMESQMDSMSADQKKMAMSHMQMAKDSMAKKDMEGCMMHMQEAHDSMMKK